jgi:hypothetical protein
VKRRRRTLALDVAIGAVAGAGATWLMDRVTQTLYEKEPAIVRKREDAARGEKTAYEIAAEKAAGLLDREVTDEQRKQIGRAIHWGLGVSAGALYGVLRNRVRRFGVGSGIAYGAAFWLLMDEAALVALGLTPPPQEFPWQTHARGLAGHLVLGGAVEAVFDAIDLV